MKIVIVGCGKVGTSIARELISTKHEITVVDINRKAVTRLSETLDVMGVVGNGATFQALADAGAETADLVIAATARDEVNLYACLMARSAGVPHTIARVRSPEYTNDLHRVKDQLGLSMSINPELTEAVEISRLLRFSGALEIDSFAKGAVELIKVLVTEIPTSRARRSARSTRSAAGSGCAPSSAAARCISRTARPSSAAATRCPSSPSPRSPPSSSKRRTSTSAGAATSSSWAAARYPSIWRSGCSRRAWASRSSSATPTAARSWRAPCTRRSSSTATAWIRSC
ncbi:MAG: NAD-binding protein [Ruminococcus sp.]|nr:NAD-binding protein [Ruminococcus sp.]